MPIISKFLNGNKTKMSPQQRQFLTQRSSWIKLGIMALVVAMVFWINIKPADKVPVADNKSQNQPSQTTDQGGKVAGVETQKEEPKKPEASVPVSSVNSDPPKTKFEGLVDQSNDFNNLLDIGKKYVDEQDFEKARVVYLRATKIAPNYRDVWYMLAFSELKLYEKNPVDNPENTLSYATWAYFHLKRANTLDPLAENVKQLLEIAKKYSTYKD